jgi:hypothetical protein
LGEKNIYEQYGGKINIDSLKLALVDFSLFFKYFKSKPENSKFVSNLEHIILFKDSELDLLEYISSITNHINSKYIGNDLDIVLNYIYELFLQMIPYIHKDLNKNMKKDKKLQETIAKSEMKKEDMSIKSQASKFKSNLFKDVDKKGNLNYVKLNDNYFCRCKLVKDVLYYVLLCHLFIAQDGEEGKLVKHKSKASLRQKIIEKKNRFLTSARGTQLKDMYQKKVKSSGSVPGSLMFKKKGRGSYKVQPDFSCMVNGLFTVLNVSMFIYECKLDNTICIVSKNNVEILNKNIVDKIIKELKTSVGGFSKSGCSSGISFTTIKQKVTNKLEGNKIDMVVRLLVEKITRACSKSITPDDLKKIKLLQNATDLFYSPINITKFAVLHGKKIKLEINKHVDNFCNGIETLMVISSKCIIQKGGAGDITEELKSVQRRAVLLVVKAILMGIALGLLYEGIKGLITSAGSPLNITIGTIKIIIGSIILAKIVAYIKT